MKKKKKSKENGDNKKKGKVITIGREWSSQKSPALYDGFHEVGRKEGRKEESERMQREESVLGNAPQLIYCVDILTFSNSSLSCSDSIGPLGEGCGNAGVGGRILWAFSRRSTML